MKNLADTLTSSPEGRKAFWRGILHLRQLARTDALWLGRHVLGYIDLEDSVHGPIDTFLHPHFKGWDEKVDPETGQIVGAPVCDLWDLEGQRYQLILDPRGHLKTSFITMTKSIQWILNYPDIRISINTAISDQAQKMLREIKGHFQYNECMRALFPEFCPPSLKAGDFGSQDEFIIPCRVVKRKEPTISVSSVGKVIAGYHYEVIVCSDLVDKENVKTPGGIREVIDHFRYLNPVLERNAKPPHHGWMTIEGTSYAFSDLYSSLRKEEESKPPHLKQWKFHIRSAEVDVEKKISLWPTRWPWEALKKEEANIGPAVYSSQYLQHPVPDSGGLTTEGEIQFMNSKVINDILPTLRLHVTIDLAGMESTSTGDYTVLTLAGFDRDGRVYVVEIHRGHFNPFEVINLIFDLHHRYPRILDFKIEKEAHARVLLPFLRREMSKRERYPNMAEIRRDTSISKRHRIKALQPWFANKLLRFNADLPCKTQLITEILEFPSGSHDDILDTLADQMQNRDGSGITYDVIPDMPKGVIPFPRPADRFLGFDPDTKQERWLLDPPSKVEGGMTGVL